MLYTGGVRSPFWAKASPHATMRSKGLTVQEHYVTAAPLAAQLKRIIACRLRIPKTAQTHGDVGISFFSFFYFDVFVLNSEPCKKWFPHRHWRCLVTSFRDVNYGSGEVCVFHFFSFCLLFCFVGWNPEKMLFFMKKYVWFWFFGLDFRDYYGFYLDSSDFHIKISIHVIIDFTFINLLRLKNL